jgi:Tol biopolymer transport system component
MITRGAAYTLFSLCVFAALSCGPHEDSPLMALPGKIVYTGPPNEYFHYAHGILHKDNLHEARGESAPFDLSWVGKSDTLLGKVYVYDSTGIRKIGRQKLMLYDSNGQALNHEIFETGPGESIGSFYASPNGKRVIIEVTQGYTAHQWNYTSGALQILDLNSGHTLQSIPFDSTLLMTVDEWPWSPDQTHFVYSARGWRHWMDANPKAGVYIYDLATGRQTEIDKKGWWAVWSPDGRYIAYIKHNDIWIHDIAAQVNRLFYKSRSFEDLSVIHWSPDGQYLRVHGWKYVTFGSWFETPFERMLQTEDGQEAHFNAIGGALYSWK